MDAVAAAVKFLARREHTRREIADKLRQRHYSEESITVAIERLCERDLLSDSRFAGSYIRQNKHRFGNQRLYLELIKRGIGNDIANNAISSEKLDDEERRATIVLALKYPSGIDSTDKARVFLAGRGFSDDDAQRAVAARLALKKQK